MEALEGYMSREAARNLWRRALKGREPTAPAQWAELLEGPLWTELRAILPFQSMPKELRALVRALKTEAMRQEEAEPKEEEGTRLPPEPVALEDPEARRALAHRLARLEGALGVAVVGLQEKEVLTQGLREEVLALTGSVHHLLRRGNYGIFYLHHTGGLVLIRPLGEGYVALWAKKEANIGHFLHALRRIVALSEVQK